MTKPQTFPKYLPSVCRSLEYQAGLFTPNAPLVREMAGGKQQAGQLGGRQWLGEDFSHIIVSR